MALVGTISGSVSGGSLVSTTAISGTLVVADSPLLGFPTLPSDVKFFVSGVQGAIASSLPGVAVFGGDLRVSGSSYFTDIDVTGHGAVVVQPYGTSAGQTGEVRFKELAANGGNYTALKAADSIAANLHITLPNAVGSNGNVLQTNGSGVTSFVDASSVVTGALSLVSINASSNITGSNALLSGDLAVNGGDLTSTQTTFNLLNSTVTTLNVGGAATNILVGGTTTTSSFTGSMQVDGRSTLSSITEKLVPSVGGTGTVAYDLSLASIFYANGPTGNITANFTNVPTTPNNRILTPTVILSQSVGASRPIVSAVQIDGAAQTINWANNVTPTGNSGKQDVFGFSLIRSGSAWKVLGQMSTYG
jgi:hypothetical protein